jgi:hypothetical protein
MSGLVARFLYCFPKSNIGKRKYDTKPIPEKVSHLYHQLVQILLEKKFASPVHEEKHLHFEEEAGKNFSFYFDTSIEPMQTRDLAECRDWGGKYHGLILRLCGILHCVECASKGLPPEETPVSNQTLCHAIDLGDYYKEQAIYAYGLKEIDHEMRKAEHVLKKIRGKGIREIRQGDLYRLCRCKLFRNSEDFDNVVTMLEEYGYVCREIYESKNNITSAMIYINPEIFS